MKDYAVARYQKIPMTDKSIQRLQNQFFDFYKISLLNQKKGPRSRYNRFFTDPDDADFVTYIKDEEDQRDYENILVVEISEGALMDLINLHETVYDGAGRSSRELGRTMINRLTEEQYLRKQHESVRLAWEQYSLMLHLSSNGKNND